MGIARHRAALAFTQSTTMRVSNALAVFFWGWRIIAACPQRPAVTISGKNHSASRRASSSPRRRQPWSRHPRSRRVDRLISPVVNQPRSRGVGYSVEAIGVISICCNNVKSGRTHSPQCSVISLFVFQLSQTISLSNKSLFIYIYILPYYLNSRFFFFPTTRIFPPATVRRVPDLYHEKIYPHFEICCLQSIRRLLGSD